VHCSDCLDSTHHQYVPLSEATDYIDLAFVGARFGREVLVLISLENFQLVGTQHLPGVALKLCVPDFIWQLRRKAW